MLLTSLVTALLASADGPPEFDAYLANERVLAITERQWPGGEEALRHAVISSVEPRRGVPGFLWAELFPGARTPRAQGLSAVEAARQHVLRYAPLYRLPALVVAQLTVSEVHDLGEGAVIVGFRRELDGVPFFRDELDVVMTHELEVVAITGSLATGTRHAQPFRLDAPAALARGLQAVTGQLVDPAVFTRTSSEGRWEWFRATAGLRSEPRARRGYYDDAERVLPAWHLELELNDAPYAVIVSALDGRLLSLASLQKFDSYRVYADDTAPYRPWDGPQGNVALPHPTGTPDGFDPPVVAAKLVTLTHAGISTGDAWGPSRSRLEGNNVHAYSDTVAPDGLDGGDDMIIVNGGNGWDFTATFTDEPTTPSNLRAGATHAFFVTNWLHDAFYDLGFTELAGNGQMDNYGRGGLGTDSVRVEVQDFSGRNNANMFTPADGAHGRLQLFLFDSARPSTLTVTGPLPDGGTFLATPPAVNVGRSWDVSGSLRTVQDLDGGYAGCDPWINPAQYTGAVVLVDGTGCPVRTRYEAALDAGVAGLVLNIDGCFALNEANLVATCVETDAGTQLRDLVVGGTTLAARLERPATVTQRDVAFDTTVVAHEYGHFVTDRLVGDSLGLMNSPARAMGEGWSDFIALWTSIRDEEHSQPGNTAWEGSFAIGTWTSQGRDFDGTVLPGAYYGVRRYPYSTDRTRNPLTFKHVGTNVPLPTTAPHATGAGLDNAEVHNAGEVWASMLWELQTKLLNAPGATTGAARVAFGQKLVAALKATPVLPTFIEARDSILAVYRAGQPSSDFAVAIDAFASRGLGILAQSSDRRSTTNTPLGEDFTGSGGNYRLVSVTVDDDDDLCDGDGQLDSGETGTLSVTLFNTGTVRMTASSMQLTSSLIGLQVSPVAIPIPANDPFTSVTVRVPVTLQQISGLQTSTLSLVVTDPALVLLQHRYETTAEVLLNVDVVTGTTEDFERGGQGWVFEADGDFPFEDRWFVRTASLRAHSLQGPDMREAGLSAATSPPLAVGTGPFTVVFTQAYTFENATSFLDGGRLEISTDGTTFTAIPGSALSPTYPVTLVSGTSNPLAGSPAYGGVNAAPHEVTLSLGTQYAGRTVWLRWIIGADDFVGRTGWTIDDVRATGLTNTPFSSVVAHRGQCANHQPVISGTSSLNAPERTDVTLVPGTVSDRDNDTLTISWMQISGPSVVLTHDTFTAPEVTSAGAVLGFRVTVSDGRGGSDTDEMTVSVRNVNRSPEVVKATAPQQVTSGATVTLSAEGTDPDGDALQFQWTQLDETAVSLDRPGAAEAHFTAPQVEASTQLSFRVVALDGTTASEPAFVAVIVLPPEKGCGCTSGGPLVLFALAGLWLRRRRR